MARIAQALLKRLGGMAIVLALVVTVVFIIVRVTPGDPAAVMLGSDATPEDIAQLRTKMGLDAPLLLQYGQFVLGILQGDLGQSIFLNQPVTTALAARAEPTFFLTRPMNTSMVLESRSKSWSYRCSTSSVRLMTRPWCIIM